MKKSIFLLFFGLLMGQDADGDFSLGEISFVIKDFHLGGAMEDRSSRSEINNGIGSLDIGLLKYGFSDIDVSGEFNDYNERAKLKYKFSGPEFEMSNFKMDISFDAPNVWEELFHARLEYIKSAYASEAKSVIGNIENGAKMYYQTYGEWPSDIEELERRGQLEIDRSTKMKWSFALSLSDDGGQITAESTEEMKGGSGKMVIYDRNRGVYTGYGSYDRYRETRSVKNNVKISVGKVNQYFGTSGSVDISDRNQIAEFQLEKAGFSVSKANATFVVDRTSKSTFSIADFKTVAKNIAFEFDTFNEIPIVEKAGFELTLTNLEINVPKEVQEDVAFQQVADYLNINSGKFRIRKISFTVDFNRSSDLQINVIMDTQFGKAIVDGSFSIRQPVQNDSDFIIENFTCEISNLTRPINDFISVWEEESGNILPRKGKSIYLEMYGDINKPQIKGLEELNF